MKLFARPHGEASRLQRRAILGIGESDMNPRTLDRLAQSAQARDQRRAPERRVPGDQQASSRRRREGNSDLELRIIAPARPRIGLGPAMIENIFALRMALGVGRRGGDGVMASSSTSTCISSSPSAAPAHRPDCSKASRKAWLMNGLNRSPPDVSSLRPCGLSSVPIARRRSWQYSGDTDTELGRGHRRSGGCLPCST